MKNGRVIKKKKLFIKIRRSKKTIFNCDTTFKSCCKILPRSYYTSIIKKYYLKEMLKYHLITIKLIIIKTL